MKDKNVECHAKVASMPVTSLINTPIFAAMLLLLASLGLAQFDPHAVEENQIPAYFTKAVELSENELDTDQSEVRSIAISPNGRLVAAGGHDQTLRIWDMETCKLIKAIGLKFIGPEEMWHPSDIMALAFSPDGKRLAAGSRDWAVRIWDLNPVPSTKESEKLIASHAGGVRSIAYSPDGTYLAAAGHERIIRLWRIGKSASEIGTLPGHLEIGTYGVNSLAFGPTSRILLSGGSDGFVRVWDIANKKQVSQFEALKEVLSVTFSPDGKLIAAAAAGYEKNQDFVLVWDLQSGQLRHKLVVPHDPWAVAFSPDGKLLAANGNWASMKIWDIQTGDLKQTLTGKMDAVMRSVAFSPDNEHIITGGYGQVPYLWNFRTGQLVKVFRKSGCNPE